MNHNTTVLQNRIERSLQSLTTTNQIDRIQKLKRLHKRKRLSDCLEVLGEKGIHGDEAIFILSNLGGARPRPQPEFINTLL